MGDLGHQLAQSGQSFGFQHLFLQGLGFRQVPDDAGKKGLFPDIGHRKGNGKGKQFPVFTGGQEFRLVADELGLPGFQITGHRLFVPLGTLGGQNVPQVFSQDLFSVDPEDPFGLPVKNNHPVVFINGDETFVGIFNGPLQDGQGLVGLPEGIVFIHGPVRIG